ncbi:MAG: O-antigen ligase family protein [Pirellulaceae bacterium]
MNISKSDELMEVGLDWQVMLKLGVSAACGLVALWGVLTTEAVRRILLSIPASLLTLMLLLAIPSALSGYSDSALPATLINFSYVVFVATSLIYLQEKAFFYAIVLGSMAACGLAWMLYFFAPEYGVFQEFLGSVTVERLGGHAHPNSVGRTAAIGLLASVALWRDRRISSPITFWLIAGFALTIVFTLSRTVMIGTVIALGMMFLDRLKTRAGLQWILLACFGGLLVIFLLVASGNEGDTIARMAGSVSKTGDTTELTTGTGRVDIWAEAIRLISEKPVTGYGFGAAQSLMIEYSQSTHNMFLHAAMVAGVFAGGIMICLALWLINVMINGQFRPVSALAVFILISGIFEDTVLETFPGPATFSFFVCCLCPLQRSREEESAVFEDDDSEPDGSKPNHREPASHEPSNHEPSNHEKDEEAESFDRPRNPR